MFLVRVEFFFFIEHPLNLIKSLSVQTLLLACDASSFVSIGALLHIFESIKFNVRIEFNFIAQHALNLIKILIYSNLSSIVMPTHCLNWHHHIASNRIHCLYESYSNFLHENTKFDGVPIKVNLTPIPYLPWTVSAVQNWIYRSGLNANNKKVLTLFFSCTIEFIFVNLLTKPWLL